MAIRMKDIARDLNVSVMTVSKVLRNHEDIGRKTRELVLKRVRELNYAPNRAARFATLAGLSAGRASVSAVLAPASQIGKSVMTGPLDPSG